MPDTLQGYDKDLFDRHAVAVMAQHLQQVEEAHMRKYIMPAQLEASGRFMYNQTGRGFDWRIQYKIHDVRGFSGTQRRTYAPKNLFKMAYLEDRGYEATDSISMMEVLQSRGSELLIADLFSGFAKRIVNSVQQHMGNQYYIDGDGNNNTDFWHGLNSMMGTNGTINVSTGAQRASNNADLVAYPSDTYAGLSTILSNYGGSQTSGVWPDGDCDRHRDFWTPLIVNGSSSAFPGTGTTWVENATYAIRFGISHAARNVGWDTETTTVVLARQMFVDYKNSNDSRQEIQVNRNDPVSLVALGFGDVVNQDGAEISTDNGVPVGTGFAWDYKNITGRSLHPTLIEQEPVEFDREDSQHKGGANILGNLKFESPRNFVKFFSLYSDIT